MDNKMYRKRLRNTLNPRNGFYSVVNPSDQRGSALILALLIMMILTMLSGGLITVVITDARLSAAYNNRIQAYYYAKSGMEVAVDTIQQAALELLGTNQGDFYLSGSLSNMTLGLGTYTGQYDDNLDIIVEVEWNGDTGEGKITTTGHHQDVSNSLIREFDYSALINEDALLNPSSEDYVLAEEMIPAWHTTSGRTNGQVSIYGGNNHADPVIWSHTQVIYDDTPSVKTFRSPVMYFVDVHEAEYDSSIRVHPNANGLVLRTNFIKFDGNVVFQHHGIDTGGLRLKTNSSNLIGADIGALDVAGNAAFDYRIYGVLYLEKSIVQEHSGNITEVRPSLGSGFYYFPDGINLALNNSTVEIGLDRLIKVSYADIDLERLGIKDHINHIPGDVNFGHFQ